MRFLALMLCPLAFTTGVFVFAGVLDPLAADLGVGVEAAGQLQSVFAISCAIAGPILTLNCNGVGEGGARALAVVYGGVSLAFISGIPLGSVVGEAFGWRASFWLASALSALACLAVLVFIPKVPAPPPAPKGAFATVLSWPTTGYLLVTMLAFAAIFSAIGYVGPVIGQLTGFSGAGIGAVQMISGLGSFLGLTIGTRMVETRMRGPLFWLFSAVLLSQAIFSVGLIGGWVGSAGLAVAVIGMLIGSISLFGTAPIVKSRLAEAAGPAATLAFALNGSIWARGWALCWAAWSWRAGACPMSASPAWPLQPLASCWRCACGRAG